MWPADSLQLKRATGEAKRVRLLRCNLLLALIHWPHRVFFRRFFFFVGGFRSRIAAAVPQHSPNYERFHRYLPGV